MTLKRRTLLLSSAPASLGAQAAVRRLRIPRLSPKAEMERSYGVVLLEQALAAAGMPAVLELTPELIPQHRALLELGSQRRLDVFWTVTSAEREKLALAVRVPILKGLLGWRLLLATPEMAGRLREVQTLGDLRAFRLVSGHDWPDTGILRANRLSVISSPGYDAMFTQLRLGRVDAFPRAVEEVWWELERFGQGLVVVPNLCLHYPAPVYYFVGPDDTDLARAIELGLLRLRQSGAMEQLFLQHHGEDVARARLGARRVIELVNPTLSPQTPLEPPEHGLHSQG